MSNRFIHAISALFWGCVFVIGYSAMVAFMATDGLIWNFWFGG